MKKVDSTCFILRMPGTRNPPKPWAVGVWVAQSRHPTLLATFLAEMGTLTRVQKTTVRNDAVTGAVLRTPHAHQAEAGRVALKLVWISLSNKLYWQASSVESIVL